MLMSFLSTVRHFPCISTLDKTAYRKYEIPVGVICLSDNANSETEPNKPECFGIFFTLFTFPFKRGHEYHKTPHAKTTASRGGKTAFQQSQNLT